MEPTIYDVIIVIVWLTHENRNLKSGFFCAPKFKQVEGENVSLVKGQIHKG